MNASNSNLFEEFTLDYDRMIPWENRLKRERPFFEKIFEVNQIKSLLDLACGTGKHAIMFNQLGLKVTGMDQSKAMVQRAEYNASEAGAEVIFTQGDFLNFQAKLQTSPLAGNTFDAVTVLGNSLPHLLTKDELHQALVNIGEVLNKDGLVLIQNRNYNKVLAEQNRFMAPNWWKEGNQEKIFFRFMDFQEEGLTFNILTLEKKEDNWAYTVSSNNLWPMTSGDLEVALREAGFTNLELYGDFFLKPYNPDNSQDLVIIARK